MLEKDETDLVGFVGSIGKDEWGSTYENQCDEEGIATFFEEIEGMNTGVCLVVCNQRDRAHITDLGASTKISEEFINRNINKFKDAILIFTELYILRDQKEFSFTLAKLGLDDHKKYGFNLPCTFFLDNFFDDITELVGYADIVFANEYEAAYYCKKLGLDATRPLKEIIQDLAKIPKKNTNKNRVFVITDGANPAYVCEYNFKENKVTYLNSFAVAPLDPKKIVDTNGAGDSFAGGFLSQYMKGKSFAQCMHAGHWAASQIIQYRGCVIPDKKYQPEALVE